MGVRGKGVERKVGEPKKGDKVLHFDANLIEI